jgi:uncharacterized protein
MKHIYHSTSAIDGMGVMAGENIKKGEVIQHIKGEIKLFVPTTKEESASYPDWVGVGKNKWIDPAYPNKYLNHSCNPNTGIKGRVTMVALKNIKEGEEITVDYSIIEGDDLWEMECRCGERNCRGLIRSIQYLPEEQYKKYLPYIPTYFQKLHNRYRHGKPQHG